MNYDIDYFIKKFEAIPEEKWITDLQLDQDGNSCALGWCMTEEDRVHSLQNWSYVAHWSGHETEEGKVLWENILPRAVTLINNGQDTRYQQATPKQRILAALQDAKRNCTKELEHR